MARLALLFLSAALGTSLAAANPWGSDSSREFAKKAYEKLSHRDYLGALTVLQDGYRQSLESRNQKAQIKFLNSIGGCHFSLFEFQLALKYFIEAKSLAERNPSEIEEHGAILFNLSSLYLASFNLEAAQEAARQGAELVQNRKFYYSPSLNLILAVLATRTHNIDQAAYYYSKAIQAADEAGDDNTLGLSFNQSGTISLANADLPAAERYFLHAYKLRKLRRDPELVYTYLGLAELNLLQEKSHAALGFIDSAETLAERTHHPIHRHLIHGLRGKVLSRLGNFAAAHREFVKAFESIRRSRADVLPADFFRVGAEASLDHLYDAALRNGARWQSQGSAPNSLAAQLWLITEEWKSSVASRPRPLLSLTGDQLGPEYWQSLAKLRQLERISIQRSSKNQESSMSQLRLRLAEMESYAGIRPLSSVISGDLSSPKAVRLLQDRLPADAALIRFHIGAGVIMRWTLTKTRLDAKELTVSAGELSNLATQFAHMAMTSSDVAEIHRLGLNLYQNLFQDSSAAALAAQQWLLALDGPLLQLPVAALSVRDKQSGRVRYVIEQRSLEIITGADALLAKQGQHPQHDESFVGVGDAIYNPADPRASQIAKTPRRWSWGSLMATEPASVAWLPRLASSRTELQKIAANWKGPSRLLMGPDANRQTAVAQIEAGASVVHFATHFIQNEKSPDRTLLALSLDAKGQPDFFLPSDTIHVKVPDTLIVLSGCHSAAGTAVPAAGLIGMTRAWLMAGAGGVVASLWSTPDDDGAIFQIFYRELQKEGQALKSTGFINRESVRPRGTFLRKAAEALRLAQLEMLRSNSWRALPKYWGTYQLAGRML